MSMSRRCEIIKCTDGNWYLLLGNFEHAHAEHDCTYYGPFATEQAAENELDGHANPGAIWTDRTGTKQPPTRFQDVHTRRKGYL